MKCEIGAGIVEDIYVIPRQAMREGSKIWILNCHGRLDIRDATVRWTRKEDLLVSADIAEGERLIASRLQFALPGMVLRADSK